MRPRTLLSLFDATGEWCRPFEAAGWNVVQLDLSLGDDVRALSSRWLHEHILQQFPTIDGLLAAPPCTHFTSSGARHWKAKDEDGRTAAMVELVRQVLRAVDLLQPDFWALENPVGRIASLVPQLGPPAHAFDPWEYAGWTDPTPDDLARLDALRARGPGRFTDDEVDVVRRVGCYTKRTQLWGRFRLPAPRPVADVRVMAQGSWLLRYGGTSARTKAERSVTPAGFARAFAAAQLGDERPWVASAAQGGLFG